MMVPMYLINRQIGSETLKGVVEKLEIVWVSLSCAEMMIVSLFVLIVNIVALLYHRVASGKPKFICKISQCTVFVLMIT